MTVPGRILRTIVIVALAYAIADAAAHRLLREPRFTPDHRMGADGAHPATRPPGPGSSR